MKQNSSSRVDRAHAVAQRTDAWVSLGERLWNSPVVTGLVLLFAGAIASALYRVFGFINQFGWAGWVLASIPSLVVAVLFAMLVNWALHVRRVRKLTEAQLLAPAPSAPEERASVEPQAALSLTANQRNRLSGLLAELEDMLRDRVCGELAPFANLRIDHWPELLRTDGPRAVESALEEYKALIWPASKAVYDLQQTRFTDFEMVDGMSQSLAHLINDLQQLDGPLRPLKQVLNSLPDTERNPVFIRDACERADRALNDARQKASGLQWAARTKRLELEGFSQ